MPAPARNRGHRFAAYPRCSADRRGTTILTSVVVATLLVGVGGNTLAKAPGDRDLWELRSPAGRVRWIVIHDLAEGAKTGVYHLEVLERKRNAPAWRFKRLASHMAVTEAALRASVRRPLRVGRVYPEQFNAALAEWRKQDAAGGAPVCDRTILACLAGE